MGLHSFKAVFITKRQCAGIAKWAVLMPLLCLSLVACSGGNTQSGGIDISALAGNYTGSFSFTSVAVARPEANTTIDGTATAEVSSANRLVLDLSNGAAILASLSGIGSFSIDVAASDAVADANCTEGVLNISGQFDPAGTAVATVSSQGLVCDGLDATLTGRIDLVRS